MAVTGMCGFELNSLPSGAGAGPEPDGWYTYNATNCQPSTAQANTGARSIRCNPPASTSAYATTVSGIPGGGYYLHFAVYAATLPSSGERELLRYGSYLKVTVTSTGAVKIYDGGTLKGTSSGTPLATPGWHWIGALAYSATSVVILQVDGADEVTGTMSSASSALYLGCGDTTGQACDIYFDDFITADAFLAPSKVALLVPIYDNDLSPTSANGGWRLGNGTDITPGAPSGHGWDAVDNIPPAGVASANETATSNIEHPGSGADGDYYRADLTTYATAGVASGDTVLAVLDFWRYGEDVSTGTKYINAGLVGNPNAGMIANPYIVAGTSAHAAETGYWGTTGRITASPSVTLGSSPVMEVRRSGTESRTACVDFMGAYVAWTPASGPPTTDAPAGLATATGAALAPARTEVAVFAPLAQATGAALAASVTAGKFVNAPTATATGAALTPTLGKGPSAGLATATGAALAPTARPEARAPAGLAAATGAALTASVTVMPNVRPDAGLATATGAALAGVAAVASFASVATSTGAALDATVSTQQLAHTEVYPDTATAAGAALDPTARPEVRPSAGLATATGVALAPQARPEARAGAGLASATGSALAPTASVGSMAATSTATGSALTATAQPTQFVYVPAELATATATALVPHLYQPVWVSPSDQTQMSETPVLVFTMPTMAGAMHFHLQLDTAATFDTGSLREAKTNTDQSGWTYWDGGAWQPVPSGGVPSIYGGNEARFTVSSPLSGGTWYRRVRVGTS